MPKLILFLLLLAFTGVITIVHINRTSLPERSTLVDQTLVAVVDESEKFAVNTLPTHKITSKAAGTYQNYTDSSDLETGRNFLLFTAPWCPSCKLLKNNLAGDGVVLASDVYEVMYAPDTKVVTDYEIKVVPTLILLENGKESERWDNSNSIVDMLTILSN